MQSSARDVAQYLEPPLSGCRGSANLRSRGQAWWSARRPPWRVQSLAGLTLPRCSVTTLAIPSRSRRTVPVLRLQSVLLRACWRLAIQQFPPGSSCCVLDRLPRLLSSPESRRNACGPLTPSRWHIRIPGRAPGPEPLPALSAYTLPVSPCTLRSCLPQQSHQVWEGSAHPST